MSIDISTENAKLPARLDFPNLRFMMIHDPTFDYFDFVYGVGGVPNKVGDGNNVICFEGMQGLKVLSISDVPFRSLPSTMKLLKELRTLRLENCFVKDISVLGELACLEILYIRRCPNIEELPTDIGRLNFLRLLELDYCESLRRIVAGVISSLVRLEELKIVRWFDKWEAKGNQSQERNAGLSELESLPNLTSLEIEIYDCNLLAEEICLSQKLVRYRIHTVVLPDFFLMKGYERGIRLYLPGDITVGNWIRQLARSTQSLVLYGELSTQFPVKPIKLADLEEIIYGTIPEVSNCFQKLESICIKNLPKLAHLWKNQNQNVSMGNLKSISIEGCPNLCNLFSMATARSLVQQLERLEIKDCDKIEQLWNEIESNTDASIIEFSNLQELTLSNLPNLEAFSQGVEIIESLHQLTRLTIKDCPRLRTKIGKCPNLRSVNFSGSQRLPCSRHTIQELAISNCDSIEEILWDEIKDEGERHIIFPELKKLKLRNLPCFTTFCRGAESIEFPKLERMTIGNLPRMNSLLPLDLVEAAHHDHHSLHFFCNPKVEIPRLTDLYLVKLHNTISKIWCRHVSINFFHNLKKLGIVDVNGISNLISSSIAKNLVNLEYLCVKECHEMVYVIEDEKEICAMTPFHNLFDLSILRSHKLLSFCQWKHALELPSLRYVRIDDCPMMETLTLGSLSTPSLYCFEIDYKQIETKDLNGGIRDRFRIKTENKEEHGDEDNKKAEGEEKIE